MTKKIVESWALLLLGCLAFFSCKCSDCEDINFITDNAGGDFLAINMATNDTLKLNGGLTINIGRTDALSVKKGNIVKLKFVPKDKYKDFNFNVTFTLPNDQEVKKPTNYEHEFPTTDLETKDYTVKLSAECKDEYKQIIAYGGFSLKVTE